MIDISNVPKEARQFGIFTITEMDDIPFMSFVDEFNEEYVFHENAFIEFNDLFSDPSKLNRIQEKMTFDEAAKELTRLMNEFFERNTSEDEEGDQYHTIDIDPNENDEEPHTSGDDLDENSDKEYDTDYEGTMLLNKSNYYINFSNLELKNCEELITMRKHIYDMASEWYSGNVINPSEMIENLKFIFDFNQIELDLSAYNVEGNKNKMVSILLFNALSYIDSLIIGIQHNHINDHT